MQQRWHEIFFTTNQLTFLLNIIWYHITWQSFCFTWQKKNFYKSKIVYMRLNIYFFETCFPSICSCSSLMLPLFWRIALEEGRLPSVWYVDNITMVQNKFGFASCVVRPRGWTEYQLLQSRHFILPWSILHGKSCKLT